LHHNFIKEAIKSGLAPKERNIPIVGIKLVDVLAEEDEDISTGIITHGNTYTRYLQKGNSKTYIMIFGGCAWTFIIPKAESNDPQKEYFLRETGTMALMKVNLYDFYPVKQLMNSVNYGIERAEKLKQRKK
jgi:hypothetical protein